MSEANASIMHVAEGRGVPAEARQMCAGNASIMHAAEEMGVRPYDKIVA